MLDNTNRINPVRSIAISARNKTYKDRVGGIFSENWYRFRLNKRSYFELELKGLRANADVELVHDHNRNQTVDLGEVVASSRAPDRFKETISIQGLDAGTYFIRIAPSTNQTTTYRLVLSAKSTSKTSFTYDVVKRTNTIREARGLHRLSLNTQLSQAAQAYAENMATQDFFSHTGADGSSWQQRIRAQGYTFSDAAENLAIGHSSPARVVDGWMGSPGHRRNMLAYQVQEIGVGYFYLSRDSGKIRSNHYWAESFGTPIGASGGISDPTDPFEQEFPSRHIEEFFNKLDR